MRMDRWFLASTLALVCAVPGLAQVSASNDELTITENNGSKQHLPAVSMLPNGSLVAWEDDVAGVVAARYNAAGARTAGPVTLAASDPLPPVPFYHRILHEMHEPSLAARADGTFLAVWTDRKVNHTADNFYDENLVVASQLMGRLFRADGTPLSPARVLSGTDSLAGRGRAVTTATGFLVVWQEKGGADPGVHIARVDNAGAASPDKLVARGQRSTIALAGDTALVTFERWNGSRSQAQILGRLYNRTGAATSETFLIAGLSSSGVGASTEAVAGQNAGGFLVAYQRLRPGSQRNTFVLGQLVSNQGQLVGGEIPLSHGYGEAHNAATVAALPGGGWLAGWVSWDRSFPVAVTVGAFTAVGNATGNEIFLNDQPIMAQETALAASSDGRLLVVWEGFGPTGIRGLRARTLTGPSH